MNKGFTLIELSIVMTIVALLLSFSLTAFTSVQDLQSAKLNREKIQMVQDAIEAYLKEYNHLPCVANRSLTPIHPDFGISFTTVSNDPCSGIPVPGVVKITPGVGDHVWIGHVPVRDLGIPENLAYDAYGNRFTYVVSEGLTDPTSYDATDSEIEVNNAAALPVNTWGTIGYTLISHGKSGVGAFSHKTGAVGKVCDVATEDGNNCNDDITFTDIARNTGSVVANFYDDSMIWQAKALAAAPVSGTFSLIASVGDYDGHIIFDDGGEHWEGIPAATKICQNDFPGVDSHIASTEDVQSPKLSSTSLRDGAWYIGQTWAMHNANNFNVRYNNCDSYTKISSSASSEIWQFGSVIGNTGSITGSTSTAWKPGWITSMAYCKNVIPIACVVPD